MPMATDPGNSGLWDDYRVKAFSDGVFAIAITVLGIELVLEWLGRHAASHHELTELGADTSNRGRVAFGRWWRRPTIVLYFVAIMVGILVSPKLAAAMYLFLAIPGVLLLDLRLRSRRSAERGASEAESTEVG
jgi:hypothetical protein